jgi:cell wall-associated NlpC family hydrolase
MVAVTVASASQTSDWGSNKMIREKFVELVKQEIGEPYRWGGQGDGGFDCSGLVNYCLDRVDMPLPTDLNAAGLADYFRKKTINRLQAPPGSLFFYNSPVSHVMVVINHWSNGTIILAGARGGTSKTKTVDDATRDRACVAQLWGDYWLSKFNFAVDPFQNLNI